MDCRPPEKRVVIEGADTTKKLSVRIDTNYADHPLVVGPRYLPQDLKCMWATHLGKNTSGVQLYGLGDGTKLVHKLHSLHPIRTYRVRGRLGYSTDTGLIDGRIVERAKYEKITRPMIDRWCASMQASHQVKMFEQSGVDIQSQSAYELAAKGPIRVSSSDVPVIYGVKCVEFTPPNFTIEVQCVNEYEQYLINLIDEIGYKVHSAATCIQLQCIRHTVFTVEDTLLRKHWTLQHVVDNLKHCRTILEKYKDALQGPSLTTLNDSLHDYYNKEQQIVQ